MDIVRKHHNLAAEISHKDLLRYIGEMALELSKMAERADRPYLAAQLLDAAKMADGSQTSRSTKPN